MCVLGLQFERTLSFPCPILWSQPKAHEQLGIRPTILRPHGSPLELRWIEGVGAREETSIPNWSGRTRPRDPRGPNPTGQVEGMMEVAEKGGTLNGSLTIRRIKTHTSVR